MCGRLLFASLEVDLLRRCGVPALVFPKRPYSLREEQRMIPFEEYRKLRRRVKTRSRLAGIPVAFMGVTVSSAFNVHVYPQMLEFQNPDVELAPIL